MQNGWIRQHSQKSTQLLKGLESHRNPIKIGHLGNNEKQVKREKLEILTGVLRDNRGAGPYETFQRIRL